jgi:hypothetical protein
VSVVIVMVYVTVARDFRAWERGQPAATRIGNKRGCLGQLSDGIGLVASPAKPVPSRHGLCHDHLAAGAFMQASDQEDGKVRCWALAIYLKRRLRECQTL